MARAALAALAGCCLVFASSVPAMEQETAGSKITIKSPAQSTFRGVVSSANPACVKGRTVKLFSAAGKAVSGGVTGKGGGWRVALEGRLKGEYYAKVTVRNVGSLACKAARSPTIAAAQ